MTNMTNGTRQRNNIISTTITIIITKVYQCRRLRMCSDGQLTSIESLMVSGRFTVHDEPQGSMVELAEAFLYTTSPLSTRAKKVAETSCFLALKEKQELWQKKKKFKLKVLLQIINVWLKHPVFINHNAKIFI